MSPLIHRSHNPFTQNYLHARGGGLDINIGSLLLILMAVFGIGFLIIWAIGIVIAPLIVITLPLLLFWAAFRFPRKRKWLLIGSTLDSIYVILTHNSDWHSYWIGDYPSIVKYFYPLFIINVLCGMTALYLIITGLMKREKFDYYSRTNILLVLGFSIIAGLIIYFQKDIKIPDIPSSWVETIEKATQKNH